MRRKQWPTYLSRWVGCLAIRILPAHRDRKPDVVYITRITKHGELTGQVLNSHELLLTKPNYLVEYSPRLFLRLDAQYNVRNARRTLEASGRRALTGLYRS